jgi:hypothetical protein
VHLRHIPFVARLVYTKYDQLAYFLVNVYSNCVFRKEHCIACQFEQNWVVA